MKQSVIDQTPCPNSECKLYGKFNKDNIRSHGSYKIKGGGRGHRLICIGCGKTFCTHINSAYYRLHNTRNLFDEVAHMSVEGISKSAIARIKGLSWNTVSRWLELAAKHSSRVFNEKHLKGYELRELQVDEIQTFVGCKDKNCWVFTILEVWSRLWLSFVVGRRSYANTKKVFNEPLKAGNINGRILITSDGFSPYEWAVNKLCVEWPVFMGR